MERKDYQERLLDFKNEILAEIRELVKKDSSHKFNEKFYIHYIYGEVATTDVCSAIEVSNDYIVTFIVQSESNLNEDVIDGEDIFLYSPESFIDILDHLKKEIRERKLAHLRELIKNAGGKVNFDGSFGFYSIVDNDHVSNIKSMITCIELDNTNKDRVYLDCTFSGDELEEQEEDIPFDQLDSIIAYVESKTKRKFNIRVDGSFSRHFEIEANSLDEAFEIAKEEWLTNPLCFEDSNGEDWTDWTDYNK